MLHPVSEFFLYILIVSFVAKQKWVYKKKKMYVSLLQFVSPFFITSFEQVFWSVTSCFRVFLIYLNPFICYKTEMGLYKKKKRCMFHHFTLFLHPVPEFFLFILLVSFVTKQKWVYKKKKKKMYVSCYILFHSVSKWTYFKFFGLLHPVSEIFHLYLIRFICYETEMSL